MTTRTPTSMAVAPGETGISAFFRRWTIPVLGALTPVMLITINIAAFIYKHLGEFRIAVTILAFVSSLLLNGWTAYNVWRVVRRKWPQSWVAREENHQNVLLIGIFVVFVTAFLTALFCYVGLGDERSIPNAPTFLTGAISIAIPIILQAVFNRIRGQTPQGQRPAPLPGGIPATYQPGQPGAPRAYPAPPPQAPPQGWPTHPAYPAQPEPPPAPPPPPYRHDPGAAPPYHPAQPPGPAPWSGTYSPPGSLPPS